MISEKGRARRWYAVQTQPHRESLAARHLINQGFEVIFPRQRKLIRHARKLQEKLVAYFPGYVFVSLDLENDRWRSVNGTLGVRSIVMCGSSPAPAPSGLIEAIASRMDSEGALPPPQDYGPGDRVRLVGGPFSDLAGTLDRLDGAGRVRILVEMLEGVMPVVADREFVTRAG